MKKLALTILLGSSALASFAVGLPTSGLVLAVSCYLLVRGFKHA